MKKRWISFLLVLTLLATIFSTSAVTALAADTTSGDTVVAFTSDVHHTSTKDDASANRLKRWLEYVTTEYGEVDALGICGDLAAYNVRGDTFWSYAQRVMDNVASLGIYGVYTTGNHEHENANFSTTTNQTAKEYIRLGVGKSAENYEIYCMGAASKTMEFPESDITALSNYLKTVGTEKPVFILSHYPLHVFSFMENGSLKTRDAANREKVIDLLNQYPNTFFIWGHNHSHDDPNYDMIQTESIGDKAINFTYAAGGSMTDPSENYYSGHIVGKGLVALISEDGTNVSLRYLDENYNPFAEWTNKQSIQYAVSFDANGGKGTAASIRVEAADDGSCLYTAPKTCDFTAPEGKHFVGWAQNPSGTAEDKFSLTGDTTLYAVWADGINLASVTMFACANPDAGLNFDVPIAFTASDNGYRGTLLLPGNVDVSQIHLSWVNGVGDTVSDGVNTYVKGQAPIASDGSSVSYTVTAADGSAEFTVQTVCEASCIIDKSVSLQAGDLKLILGGVDLGTFNFAKSGSSWTIRDANNKYIGISNKVLSRSSTAFKWTYSNNKFSASVSSYSGWRTSTTTYYLTVSNGALTVSTSNRNNTASFRIHQENKSHTYQTEVTNPTCTSGGYTTYTCECGASYIGNRTDPIPHTYTAVATAPTCTEGGYTTYTCECGASYIGNRTDPISHTYTAVVTAPTCTEGGYTTYTCKCGDSYVDDQTEPVGHTYTAVVTAPTCTEGGYTTYTCKCGDSYVGDQTEPTGHSYNNGYCSICGTKDPNFGPVCESDKAVSLQAGNLRLIINGTDMGTFTFSKSGSSWTIRSADGKYVGISNKALSYSSTAFKWTFSNNRFSAAVKSSSGWWSSTTTTYYLSVNNGALTVSTSNRNNTASFRIHTESNTHSFGAWTPVSDGTHSRACSVCGEIETGECTYGSDHLCTLCGSYDPSKISVNAKVSVTSSTSGNYWSRKTTYKATITATAVGTNVATVQYSTDKANWKTGTSYSSTSRINTLYVKITDERGTVYSFVYSNGNTTAA